MESDCEEMVSGVARDRVNSQGIYLRQDNTLSEVQ